MMITRIATSLMGKSQIRQHFRPQLLAKKQNLYAHVAACRFISAHHITKNIELISQDNQVKINNNVVQNLNSPQDRPLLVLLCWMMSKRKHMMKYASFYMEQGFDVVMVSISPWQLIWPVKGSRLVALDLLKFLEQNKGYEQILLHGFSVGGYMWGEVLDFIHMDRKKYDNVIDRIVGHIWDSAVDVAELQIGVGRAVFPNNVMLQTALQKYLDYHMKTFYKQATQYYIRSSQLYHTNLVRSPALFLVSKTDPVGTVESNMRVRNSWDSLGVETYVKIFEGSSHVGHFQKHPKEYIAELYKFLDRLHLIQDEEKVRARL
ncbi:transmembrane protein 53 [Cephus cinctus]|uniref:Transmembrane protein 53 n=1 Tax=Cephus cinctus TaxID=211228 RepID=A0AAJ7CB76_CEPCN|nr:transmembrane protein 53 [Cephus cinctus]XP_015605485.1 transmembrane protein 53 [Cephus cinctus]XP_015605486.1 transmembrane protein 53 [Cephus cinctus]XP_015605487.1 transmembrane protein 53 [Cephus cinctus]XP_015605488.1 transmembrane protein 53 [Cephus cinctus]XP_024945657.1 transmembrane protein 53 [Cephus cinctus]